MYKIDDTITIHDIWRFGLVWLYYIYQPLRMIWHKVNF